jgi:hypothetical protein
MATGEPPFTGQQMHEIMLTVGMLGEPPKLDGVPAQLHPILLRCLQTNSQSRPAAAEVGLELDHLLTAEQTTPPTPTPTADPAAAAPATAPAAQQGVTAEQQRRLQEQEDALEAQRLQLQELRLVAENDAAEAKRVRLEAARLELEAERARVQRAMRDAEREREEAKALLQAARSAAAAAAAAAPPPATPAAPATTTASTPPSVTATTAATTAAAATPAAGLVAPTRGATVIRGPTWQWGDQDGGAGNTGLVTQSDGGGWVSVTWSNGHENRYRFHAGRGHFDVVTTEQSASLAATARPSGARPSVGAIVRATADAPAEKCLGVAGSGRTGQVMRDDRDSQPFQVQCLQTGAQNWYRESEVELAPAAPLMAVGTRVCASALADADLALGGLRSGRQGTITRVDHSDTTMPYYVQWESRTSW